MKRIECVPNLRFDRLQVVIGHYYGRLERSFKEHAPAGPTVRFDTGAARDNPVRAPDDIFGERQGSGATPVSYAVGAELVMKNDIARANFFNECV